MNSRQDDYVFEAGKTYEFTVQKLGATDGVNVTITDSGNDWTTVNNVTNPYTLPDLCAQTTYQYKVQGVNCDGNGSTTDWSEAAIFTMPTFYTKHIEPYTADGGYYLIASPIGQVNPTNVGGMLDNVYDLYYFDQAQGLEWRNYKTTAFDLVPGKGYLYANGGNNGEGIDIVFAGTANTENNEVTLTLESGVNFGGWNLVGNPFAVEAYIDRDFYTMNPDGSEIIAAERDSIAPMEGVFVIATQDEETLTFTTTQPGSKTAQLNLNLTKGDVSTLQQAQGSKTALLDRAVIRFGEGSQLPKLQLREGSTKVYIPQNGMDYAVVYTEGQGEMLLNFKAEEDGTYTLSFNAEEMSFAYLHLIDNLTGEDVDSSRRFDRLSLLYFRG